MVHIRLAPGCKIYCTYLIGPSTCDCVQLYIPVLVYSALLTVFVTRTYRALLFLFSHTPLSANSYCGWQSVLPRAFTTSISSRSCTTSCLRDSSTEALNRLLKSVCLRNKFTEPFKSGRFCEEKWLVCGVVLRAVAAVVICEFLWTQSSM